MINGSDYTINGKTYRNLYGQVIKNAQDIQKILESGGGSGATFVDLTEIDYEDLKALIDDGKLVIGVYEDAGTKVYMSYVYNFDSEYYFTACVGGEIFTYYINEDDRGSEFIQIPENLIAGNGIQIVGNQIKAKIDPVTMDFADTGDKIGVKFSDGLTIDDNGIAVENPVPSTTNIPTGNVLRVVDGEMEWTGPEPYVQGEYEGNNWTTLSIDETEKNISVVSGEGEDTWETITIDGVEKDIPQQKVRIVHLQKNEGTTAPTVDATYTEILADFNAGKMVFLEMKEYQSTDTYILPLTTVFNGEMWFVKQDVNTNYEFRYNFAYLRSDNRWGFGATPTAIFCKIITGTINSSNNQITLDDVLYLDVNTTYILRLSGNNGAYNCSLLLNTLHRGTGYYAHGQRLALDGSNGVAEDYVNFESTVDHTNTLPYQRRTRQFQLAN